ncbi:MAG TPA: hypothetical protein PLQ93_00855, partial [Bacteroidia bacterium]|nr:hypothetical protein [Bacteroidia bacterium]
MDRILNKLFIPFMFFCFNTCPVFGQDMELDQKERSTFDYKDPEQFRNYNKRRKAVAFWQIGELKNGALVVRLEDEGMPVCI